MEPLNIAEYPNRRLTTREAARILGYSPGTLYNMRAAQDGPVYHKENPSDPKSKVWYMLVDVLDYMERTSGKRIVPAGSRVADDLEKVS